MKAVRFHEYGDPSVLRYEDVERPVPGPGEVRRRVAASTFIPVDDGIGQGRVLRRKHRGIVEKAVEQCGQGCAAHGLRRPPTRCGHAYLH